MSQVDQYLEEARSQIVRLTPAEANERAKKDGGVIIDTRPESFRREEGAIPGALIIERNVLEWRLDPTSPHSIPQAREAGFNPIIMCNEGYASSLAVRSLHQLGVTGAVDLDGGFRRWKAEGLPVEAASSGADAPSKLA